MDKTLILYADDFCKDKIWYDICDCLQVPHGTFQVNIKYSEVDFTLEGEEDGCY